MSHTSCQKKSKPQYFWCAHVKEILKFRCLLNYFILFSLLFFHKLQGEDERKQIKKWRQRHIKALMTTLLVSLEKSWQVESNNTKKYYKHWMELTTRVFIKYLDSLFFMVLTESTLITNKNLFYIIKFILSKFFQ
jgi:hypothetical protein